MTIKAIETRYAGCRFRSRLEARWAVFFDTLGIEWQYEPEGFELPSGWYLPDFLLSLKQGRVWFEVKPGSRGDNPFSPLDDARLSELASESHPLYVSGDLPTEFDLSPNGDHGNGIGWMSVTWGGRGGDYGHVFCACPYCKAVGIQFEGRSNRIRCCQRALDDRNDDLRHTGHNPRILAAYAAARSARFEHGENGGRR